jgi:hypothetical protein
MKEETEQEQEMPWDDEQQEQHSEME